jgi:formylglycine-generating enzyme required for sulfatase activity
MLLPRLIDYYMSNIRSKISLLFVIILGITESISSQTVQNVYATQSGNDILVNYTLDTSSPCEVSLFLSFDNGVRWQSLLTDCTGDIGKNIGGGQKQIKWNVLASREQLVGSGFQFKIKAIGITIFEPEMIFVEGGTFLMGSESGERDEMPIRAVELSSFSIGKYEITQAQWKAIMGNNPSSFSGCDNCPVEFVSWDDVQTFVSKLNHLTGKKYRLPTEAEWEYAARGGKKGLGYVFSGNNDLNSVAWNSSNSLNITHPVGLKMPNELGIYDMTGNVWEWCADWYGNYSSSSLINPRGVVSGKRRVVRGGCWSYYSQNATNSLRFQYRQDNKQSIIGFRLVLS